MVEVLFHLGLVQLLQNPLLQVLRPFPEDGMRLLAAVGVDLLVACDLLDQVGQEERANMGRQRSGRGARYEGRKPGSRLNGAGFSGDGFLAMPSDHLRGVERDEPKAQALAGS